MNATSWTRARELFQRALEQPSAERERFVREATSDRDLVATVLRMLEEDAAEDEFLEHPDLLDEVSDDGPRVRVPGLFAADFDISSEVGSGAMGVVYRAWQRSLERPVAIKVLRRELGVGEREVLAFQREAAMAARLDHPNLVSIHEVGVHEGVHFIVMALVEGHNLRDELRLRLDRLESAEDAQQAWSDHLSWAVNVVHQVASALAVVHEAGLVHRDVKPSNILLDRRGDAQLVDFGVAKDTQRATRSMRIVGSEGYMSPEQLLDPANVDARTDLYALGVVMRELLGLTSAAREQDAVRLVPEALRAICIQALAENPEDRYASAAELLADLGAFAQGRPLAPRRVPRDARARVWTRAAIWSSLPLLAGGLWFAREVWGGDRESKNHAEFVASGSPDGVLGGPNAPTGDNLEESDMHANPTPGLTPARLAALTLAGLGLPADAQQIGPNDILLSTDFCSDAQELRFRDADVAYDPDRDEYLVVWVGWDCSDGALSSSQSQIFAQLVRGDTGQPVSGSTTTLVSTSTQSSSYPAVAYDPTLQEWLVAYDGSLGGANQELYLQRLKSGPAGALSQVGSLLQVSTINPATNAGLNAAQPDIARNSSDGSFLIVWSEDAVTPNYNEIVARAYQPGGNLSAPQFQLSSLTPNPGGAPLGGFRQALGPAVDYDADRDQYLVCWVADDPSFNLLQFESEVCGRFVFGTNPAPAAPVFQVSEMDPLSDAAWGPKLNDSAVDVVYGAEHDEFLVVWVSDDNTEIKVLNEEEVFGARVGAASMALVPNSQTRLTHVGPDAATQFRAATTRAAYDPMRGEYYLSWTASDFDVTTPGTQGSNEYELYGQRLAGDLTVLSPEPVCVSDMGEKGQPKAGVFSPLSGNPVYPTGLVYNSTRDEFYAAFEGDDEGDPVPPSHCEIWGQRLLAGAVNLTANIHQMSVANGGTQVYSMNQGDGGQGNLYFWLGTFELSRQIDLSFGFPIPMPADVYTTALFGPASTVAPEIGVLLGGQATASLTLPPNVAPALVGQTAHHYFVEFNFTTLSFEGFSNPVPLSFLP